MLSEQLHHVRQRIQQACHRSGRDPSSVVLVCVTKGIRPATVREVLALGVTDLGENRIQEAQQKFQVVSGRDEPGAKWHLIGHLQRNKAKDAVALFESIHSVDSIALAEELERRAAQTARTLEVFVQVNVSGEATKFGCAQGTAVPLARRVIELPHLRLNGLMTLAPWADDAERSRPCFRQLRQIRGEVAAAVGREASRVHLSMGMSQDFEVAIEEGADYVRVGTAIFQGQGSRAT